VALTYNAHRGLKTDSTGPDVPAAPPVAPPGPNAGQGRPAGTEPWQERQAVAGSIGRQYKWPSYNLRVHPPLDEVPEDSDEAHQLRLGVPAKDVRPAYICHMRALVKYSPKKMNLIAQMVRGLSVDEAVRQLQFLQWKGATVAKEVISLLNIFFV
jgi:hypothetical protein